jgi:hypothetical protein
MKKLKNYPNWESHPFFRKIIENWSLMKMIDENSKCDETFSFYIQKVARLCKHEYFIKVLKFITLYRECLNFTQIENPKNNKDCRYEYVECNNSEDVPDISNIFIMDYLETDTQGFDFTREEAIDLTQNFCQWLYDNNFTCSKLSLLSNS